MKTKQIRKSPKSVATETIAAPTKANAAAQPAPSVTPPPAAAPTREAPRAPFYPKIWFPADITDPRDQAVYAAAFRRGFDGKPVEFATKRTLPILERGWKRGWVNRPVEHAVKGDDLRNRITVKGHAAPAADDLRNRIGKGKPVAQPVAAGLYRDEPNYAGQDDTGSESAPNHHVEDDSDFGGLPF